ncbi:UNVERIFIED_CONTAM: hypothetical protein Sradi_5703700 [Sesamum radiatum]|uniref:Reverse transcriptase/retrotransposon-derived protein RNase H-like domain-containing protein n=1 Tax=Sesamum radiatum TaxID=300843 RepID=A0AAW2L371_SESRA
MQVKVLEEYMALDPSIGESIFELEALPPLHLNLAFIELPQSHTKLLPSILQTPTLELKELPKHLKYAYLGKNETLPEFSAYISEDQTKLALKKNLTPMQVNVLEEYMALDPSIGESIFELEALPPLHLNLAFIELPQSNTKLLPSILQTPTLELKELPKHLKYAYLGKNETLPEFSAYISEDQTKLALEVLEEYMPLDPSIGESIIELEARPPLHLNLAFIELPQSHTKLLPSILQTPTLELKELPKHLKYAYLGKNETLPTPTLELKELPKHLKYAYLGKNEKLPVIISSKLSTLEEEKLIRVLRELRELIGWTIADIKGLSPSTCMHRILLEEGAKPSREAQRRFLKTARKKIDVHNGTLTMKFDGEVIRFNIYESMRYPSDVPTVLFLDRPTLELKELPKHLKYAYLGKNETLPVIICSKHSTLEEEKLIRVLREFRELIGWTIADIKGLSPSTCMHRILLEEGAKPSLEAQRRFLKTARTKINVHNGTLTIKFDGEVIRFNIYESMRYPSDVPTVLFLDVIDPLVQEFSAYISEDRTKLALKKNLTPMQVNVLEEYMALDPSIGESIFELEALPPLHLNLAFIELPQSNTKLLPSILQTPTLELKELPKHLKYAYLGKNETLPVIISGKLSTLEEEKCASILLEEGAKPSLEAQRRFLKTARTKIDVHNGTLTMEFDGEVIRFNIYESMRYPSDVPTVLFLDVIDPLVQEFSAYISEDQTKLALEKNLTPMQVKVLEEYIALDPSIENIFELESLPPLHLNLAFIELPQSHTKLLPSILQTPTLELKELPKHLKYAYLGKNETLPVIISSKLSTLEEEKLIRVLREFRESIDWTTADIKGLSPSTCMHRILLEEGAKPSREAQRRLNPPMMEVVKKEILKLLDAGFYRRFIKDFSKIAQPLCKLLQKDETFEFDEACKVAFNKLKDSLTSAPIIQPQIGSFHLKSCVMQAIMLSAPF